MTDDARSKSQVQHEDNRIPRSWVLPLMVVLVALSALLEECHRIYRWVRS